MSKYSIFHVQGGLGKHIAATAVAECIKNNFPDRKLIVVCVYKEIFINLDFVYRVYELGNTNYFYQNYIENVDSLIFHNDPYYTTEHIHKKLPLIQNWCKMYNLTYNNEKPILVFNELQKEISKTVWKKTEKPIMVIHTNGGLVSKDAKPYMWARDMPLDVANEIVNKYHNNFLIYQVTKSNSKKLDNTIPIEYSEMMKLSTLEYLSILIHSDVRVLIDSSLQHAAAALGLESVVLWNGTSPKVFGYDIHKNIESKKDYNFKLPSSYLFDFDFNGNENEYPYKEGDKIFEIDEVFNAIDNSIH
jgi:hypothetical protein